MSCTAHLWRAVAAAGGCRILGTYTCMYCARTHRAQVCVCVCVYMLTVCHRHPPLSGTLCAGSGREGKGRERWRREGICISVVACFLAASVQQERRGRAGLGRGVQMGCLCATVLRCQLRPAASQLPPAAVCCSCCSCCRQLPFAAGAAAAAAVVCLSVPTHILSASAFGCCIATAFLVYIACVIIRM